MRHCYFRILMGLIWMSAALASAFNRNFSMTALYGVMGTVFLYTAYTMWKQQRGEK